MRGDDLPWVWISALKRNGISCECRLPRLQRCPYLLCKEIPSSSKRETRQLFGEAGLDTEKRYGNPPERGALLSRLGPSASELNFIGVRLTKRCRLFLE
jgi:hypothetical protein